MHSLSLQMLGAGGLEQGADTTAVCTPLYLAPEMCRGGGSGGSGASADVWALGVTLYEAAAQGRHPFCGDNAVRATGGVVR